MRLSSFPADSRASSAVAWQGTVNRHPLASCLVHATLELHARAPQQRAEPARPSLPSHQPARAPDARPPSARGYRVRRSHGPTEHKANRGDGGLPVGFDPATYYLVYRRDVSSELVGTALRRSVNRGASRDI
jgi:hypothetical protein